MPPFDACPFQLRHVDVTARGRTQALARRHRRDHGVQVLDRRHPFFGGEVLKHMSSLQRNVRWGALIAGSPPWCCYGPAAGEIELEVSIRASAPSLNLFHPRTPYQPMLLNRPQWTNRIPLGDLGSHQPVNRGTETNSGFLGDGLSESLTAKHDRHHGVQAFLLARPVDGGLGSGTSTIDGNGDTRGFNPHRPNAGEPTPRVGACLRMRRLRRSRCFSLRCTRGVDAMRRYPTPNEGQKTRAKGGIGTVQGCPCSSGWM